MKQNRKLDDPEVLDELIYIRAYRDFEFFVSYFFEHHCGYPFSPMHLDFCRAEKEPARRRRREAIAAPRGHAKSTFKTLFKVIHAIVYGYEPFILILGNSMPEARDKVNAIRDELESNERLIQVYGALAPSKGSRWKFVTQNGTMVMAKSKSQQIRGLRYGVDRPSLIILDDAESPDGVLNEEQRQKTRDWFYKDVLKCGQIDGSSNVIVVGTCLHPDSLLSELLRAPGWESNKYQAVIHFSKHPELWTRFNELYMDLSNPKRGDELVAFYKANENALLEGTEVLWPEAENYLKLMLMQLSEGKASFHSEKQNEPYDPERQIFDMERAKRVRLVFDGKSLSEIHWLDGSGKTVPRKKLDRIVAFHDPALGKKPGQGSEPDFAAIVVVAQDVDGYLYCLDAWIEKQVVSVQVERALLMYEKWGFETLYLEDNNFQELLKQTYADAQEKQNQRKLRVYGVSQHTNKMQRISTLEPEITYGHLLFADSVHPRLINQLALFPTTSDDGPDALQGAVAQLKKPNSNQMYERFYGKH